MLGDYGSFWRRDWKSRGFIFFEMLFDINRGENYPEIAIIYLYQVVSKADFVCILAKKC